MFFQGNFIKRAFFRSEFSGGFLFPGVCLILTLFIASCFPVFPLWGNNLDKISLPPGFSISIYSDRVPGARSMALGPAGTLFVGTRREGKVYALISDPNGKKAREVMTIARGLHMPNGVTVHRGDLYVAEVSRILRYDDIEKHLRKPPSPVVVTEDLPKEEHHGWKYIDFGPDRYLYVPVGAPCNVCESDDSRFSTILRMKPDGSDVRIFAQGVRNTVGFDWHPETGVLWFTDNGRDWMGDDRPPDELNRAAEGGLHFGFPYCHGKAVPDPDFGQNRSCDEFIAPAMELGPHVAALGMVFYTGDMFPPEYHNRIFIAEHGSWNRTVPIGYRLMVVRLNREKAIEYMVFAEGWLQGGTAWGRPVDVIVSPDGALLVSDDRAGMIYRIDYQP